MDELERQEQLLREAMRSMDESMTVTADNFFRLNKETSKLGKTIENAEEALDRFWRGPVGKTTKAFGDLAKGALDSGLAARKNRESFESLNPAIEGVASALSAIPIVGDALGKTLSGVGTFVTAELQRSVEAFQTLGSVGGVGAAGLTGLKDSAREAGLAFDQLAKITSTNAKGLAFATGSTAEGAKAVAELTRAARPFQNQLLALGVGIQDQSEYFADYLQINRRLNRSQTRDYRSLATGAADYVKQLNLLSRLTGESADAMKAELEAQMSNVQFRAALQLIPEDLRKGAQNIAGVIGSIDKQLGMGIQDMFGGAIGTKAAQDVFKATGGQAQDIIDQYKNRLITQEEALARIQEAALRQRETIGDEFVAVAGNMPHAMTDVMLGMYNLADASNITRESLAKTSAEALAAAQAQDPQTKGMINAQQSLQGFATQMDAFVDSQVMPNATKVIEELVGGLDKVAGGINKLAGSARAKGGPVSAGSPYLVGEEGPEIFSPGASGQITNADITSRLAAIAQGSQYMAHPGGAGFQDRGGLGYGTMQLVEGLKQTFMPGIGNVAQYSTGNIERTIIETLDGALEEYTSYTIPGGLTASMAKIGDQMYGNARFAGGSSGKQGAGGSIAAIDMNTGYQQLGGPRSYYDSIMSGVNPMKDATTKNNITDTTTTGQAQNDKLLQMQETMLGVLQQVANNTKTGADTSKQLLRASAG